MLLVGITVNATEGVEAFDNTKECRTTNENDGPDHQSFGIESFLETFSSLGKADECHIAGDRQGEGGACPPDNHSSDRQSNKGSRYVYVSSSHWLPFYTLCFNEWHNNLIKWPTPHSTPKSIFFDGF